MFQLALRYLSFPYKVIFFTLFIAIAYYGLGKLSALLAIPPGFASPIWPPAGLALACLLLMGERYALSIFLGSFFLNAGISFDILQTGIAWSAIGNAALIGMGATLQGVVSSRLIKLIHPNTKFKMESESEIGSVLLVGGPIGCLINAVIGTTSLWLFDFIPFSKYSFTIFNWWVGDSIGVIAVTPILLICSNKFVQRGRKLIISIPLICLLSISTVIFIISRNVEEVKKTDLFEKQVSNFYSLYSKNIKEVQNSLEYIHFHYKKNKHVNEKEFQELVKIVLDKNKYIQAFEWIPKVTDRQREQFEKIMRNKYPDFAVKEKNNQGQLVKASQRKIYYPVHYITPMQGSEKVRGYDLGSNAMRLNSILKSYQKRKPIISEPIKLMQFEDPKAGFLLFYPVHVEQNKKNLKGFILSVFNLDKIVKEIKNTTESNIEHINIHIYKTSNGEKTYFGKPAVNPYWSTTKKIDFYDDESMFLEFSVLGGDLSHSWNVWAVLVAGLFFSSLFGSLLLIITAKTEHVKEQVSLKTQALDRVNIHLKKSNVKLEKQKKITEHIAFHDHLTNLPNRAAFHEIGEQVISESKRHGHKFAILFLDLDNFKKINDQYGHPMGDKVLMHVANKIRSGLRKEDILSRVGGDELIILLKKIKHNLDAKYVAENILKNLNGSIEIEGLHLSISVSIGISNFPESSTDLDELFKQADMAMYFAKKQGKGNYQFYSKALSQKNNENALIEHELRKAFKNNEIILFYQPIYEIATKEIMALEALCRWQHPEKGLILPDKFLPVAEESGLMIELGACVIKKACADYKTILSDNAQNKKISLSINFSPTQLMNTKLITDLMDSLAENKLDNKKIAIEVTEHVFMDSYQACLKNIEFLKKAGIKFMIDDFGTGFSSFDRLKKLPIDSLKIDKSFIDNMQKDKQKRSIVKSIIGLGIDLELNVIAEGIETKEQLEIIHQYGCQRAQGFYLSKPLSLEQLRTLIT